jgi:hypothetical protein
VWLIDFWVLLDLIHGFDCRRREKEGEEMIDGKIADLENNFIIIDYEIVAGNKKKRTQGVTQF